MLKNHFGFACALLLLGIGCHENDQQPMSPANGNVYDSPGTRPPRPSSPSTGGTSSMIDAGPLSDGGVGLVGPGGGGGVPGGGAYNANDNRSAGDSKNMPVGPQ
jgi:hypothetical protein